MLRELNKRFIDLIYEIVDKPACTPKMKRKSGLGKRSTEEIPGNKYGNVIPQVPKTKNVLAIRGRALP